MNTFAEFMHSVKTQLDAWFGRQADEVSNVDANVSMAQRADEDAKAKALGAIYDVNKTIYDTRVELGRVQAEIEKDNQVLKLSREANDQETFNDTAKRLLHDQADQNNLHASLDHQSQILERLGAKVDDMSDEARERLSEGRRMIAEDREATVTNMVDRASAGLEKDTAASYMGAAHKALDRKKATAYAAHEMSEGATPQQRLERKRAAYLQQGDTNPTDFAAKLWDDMDPAKAQPAATK